MLLITYSFGKVLISVLTVSIILLVLYIAYKKIIAKVNQGVPVLADYCVLYSLEQQPASGVLEFYFTCQQQKNVRLELLNEDMSFNCLITEQLFNSGGNIIRFDSMPIENGIYYYCLQTENQKTMKKFKLYNA
jgi:hypothetical protein